MKREDGVRVLLLTVCVGIIFCTIKTGVAYGEPGVNSDVCNDEWLSGKSKGVCNAYCEAMDCDSAEPNASESACQSQLERFVELTGVEPPCNTQGPPPAIIECPCSAEWWRLDQFPPDPTSAVCSYQDFENGSSGSFILLEVGNAEETRQLAAGIAYNRGGLVRDLFSCYEQTLVPNQPDTLEGAIEFYNAYPSAQSAFDQIAQSFYDVCMADLIEIAGEFQTDCVSVP
jgi:hypothetical protein